MRRMLAHPVIVDVLTRIIGPNVKCMQSMLFIKAAGMPGQAWHQDEDYIPTRDRSLCGAWIALDDATLGERLLARHPRITQAGHPLAAVSPQRRPLRLHFRSPTTFPLPTTTPCRLRCRGAASSFSMATPLHRSLPNCRPRGFRRALVNHYMSAESFLPWYQRPESFQRQERLPRHRPGGRRRPVRMEGNRGNRPAARPRGRRRWMRRWQDRY